MLFLQCKICGAMGSRDKVDIRYRDKTYIGALCASCDQSIPVDKQVVSYVQFVDEINRIENVKIAMDSHQGKSLLPFYEEYTLSTDRTVKDYWVKCSSPA
jgi:hypothetical protein